MNDGFGSGADRRGLLAGALGAAALLAAPPALAAQARLDLDDPKDRLRAFMLMRGALDDQLVIGFVSGRYYGVIDEEIRPLYGVVGATFSRYRARLDGGFDGASYEVPFFTDLETGRVLDRWTNPYTGEEVAVPQTAFPPAALVIQPNLEITLPKPPPGLVSRDHVLAPLSSGPDVWMTEEGSSTFTIPGRPKPVRYSELVTLHARRADLETPGVKRVPCQTAFTAVVSWRPWLKMGDRPGHLMADGAGRYGASMDEMPAAWTAAAAARRPDVLADPARALAGLLPI